MGRDDNLVGGITIWSQIVTVQDGRWSGGEMYPVLGTVDSSSIFSGKQENNQGKFSRGTLEGMKDIPDGESSQSKGTEAYTSCCVQVGQKAGGAGAKVPGGACTMPRAETNKEAEPDSEGPYLLC